MHWTAEIHYLLLRAPREAVMHALPFNLACYQLHGVNNQWLFYEDKVVL
jgi:hypothetical protein